MRRREVIAGLAGATAVWPHRTNAQQINRIRRIVCLVTGSPDSHGAFVTAFRQRLGEMGYVEGRDLAFDVRWAHGHVERLSALADESGDLFAAHATELRQQGDEGESEHGADPGIEVRRA